MVLVPLLYPHRHRAEVESHPADVRKVKMSSIEVLTRLPPRPMVSRNWRVVNWELLWTFVVVVIIAHKMDFATF